jgi:hypothetical protein
MDYTHTTKVGTKELIFKFGELNGKTTLQFKTTRMKNWRWQYSFRNEERAAEHMQETIDKVKRHEQRKAERKAKRNQPHTLQVGDILTGSWGYDQTNVEYYKVVSVTKHSATIEKLGLVKKDGDTYATYWVTPGSPTGKTFNKRVTADNRISFECYSLKPWDGKPKMQTEYA